MTTSSLKIFVLQNLLTSVAFEGITSATITVDTKAKSVNITANDTVFTKAADQVLVKEGDEPLKDGVYNVTLGVDEAVNPEAKVILSCTKNLIDTTVKAVNAAAVVGEKATKRSTSGCRYNPDLIGY